MCVGVLFDFDFGVIFIMKVIEIIEFGVFDVLKFVECLCFELKCGEVLIKVVVFGVNWFDVF